MLESLSTMPNDNPKKHVSTSRPSNSEAKQIEVILAELRPHAHSVKHVLTGIGDDTAVVKGSSSPLLFCSDAMVEGVHFDLCYVSPEDLGHRALAACLSDIAAMGGTPQYAVISLALPKTLADDFLARFYRGAGALADKHECAIVGGDLSGSPQTVFVDVACVGTAESPVLRSGARPGDLVFVSGVLGRSAAGLTALKANILTAATLELRLAHLRPQPRFDLAKIFATNRIAVTSLIDLSDGLSSDLIRLCDASKVGCRINSSDLPIDADTQDFAQQIGASTYDWALNGGEDYQLLGTIDPRYWSQLKPAASDITVIGEIMPLDQGRLLKREDEVLETIKPQGFDHFSR